MTVRGEGCMEDTHHRHHHSSGSCHSVQVEHTHKHTGQNGHAHQPTAGTSGHSLVTIKHTAGGLKGLRSVSEQSEEESEIQENQNPSARGAEIDDELPLGSEANSLGQAQHGDSNGFALRPPVDKRLLSLRRGGGGGGGGLIPNSQLLHSGWTSFNSDVSNLTSGSANSHSSVEWLLQERQVDPEQVLLNLGFGGGGGGVSAVSSYSDSSMYSRIPERFLQRQDCEAAQDEDGTQEGAAGPEGTPRRNPSRAAAAWSRARTMSSTLMSLKLLSSLQPPTPMSLFQSMGPSSLPPGSFHGSSPSLTPPGHPRSVLHPDNQRALARQGFYGDNLPEGLEPSEVLPQGRRDLDGEHKERRHRDSAEDRRKQFHKTRSKRRSTVESGEEDRRDVDPYSQDSIMKSVDFSTTTESTDSGDLSTSAPTTPGDVFLDRTPSPSNLGIASSSAGPSFPVERPLDVDEQYLPDKGAASLTGNLSRSRQKLTEKYQADLDNDGNYFISPPGSRQPTIEKAATLTETDLDGGGGSRISVGEGASADIRGGSSRNGGGGSAAYSEPRASGSDPHSSRSGNINFDHKTKSVTIVVSEDGKMQRVPSPSESKKGLSYGGNSALASGGDRNNNGSEAKSKNGGGKMSFLNIVNAAVADRMSDSGSDYTLVDQHSSSSGSPRPIGGSESPRFPESPGAGDKDSREDFDSHRENTESHESSQHSGTVLEPSKSPRSKTDFRDPSGKEQTSGLTRPLPQGPVLYVYHKGGARTTSPRDENDNLRDNSVSFKSEKTHYYHENQQTCDEDLPRMSSIQSDSSGFGDAEVVGENPALEMSSLKVSNLGSSCESSATMASSTTITGSNNNDHNFNGSFNCSTDRTHAHIPSQMREGPKEVQRHKSQSTDDLRLVTPSSLADSSHRFVTTCYIPHLNTRGVAGSPALRFSSRSSSLHNSQPSLTPVSSGSKSARTLLGKTSLPMTLRDRDTRRERGFVEYHKKNETPLSEELAFASGVQASTSTPRFTTHHTVFSVPKLAFQKPTLDSSSVEGSRGSGDELEHDERRLSYTSWSRDLPSSLPRGSHRHRYYAMEGEDGDGESGASVEGSSVYSCASTSDSIASGSSSELLDCQKLIRLINQPTIFKGRKTHLVHYRPKRHLRDWPLLLKKKKLQEETRLAQYAMQKYKTELSIMETSIMIRYQMAYEDLAQEDREDVEELQHLWSEVRRQVMETEQLLTSRMKAVAAGNDNFNSLASISVLHRLIELLKEQLFQKQVAIAAEEEEEFEEEEELEERERRRMHHRPRGLAPRYSWGSLTELPHSQRVRGRNSSSSAYNLSHGYSRDLGYSPIYPDASFDQMRTSLLADIRSEMRTSLNTLQEDLLKRDNEIHKLQLRLMLEKREKKSRSTPTSTRMLPRKRRDTKETDV